MLGVFFWSGIVANVTILLLCMRYFYGNSQPPLFYAVADKFFCSLCNWLEFETHRIQMNNIIQWMCIESSIKAEQIRLEIMFCFLFLFFFFFVILVDVVVAAVASAAAAAPFRCCCCCSSFYFFTLFVAVVVMRCNVTIGGRNKKLIAYGFLFEV